MATKHENVVTQCEGLPPINSYTPLNVCSREVSGQIKNIIFPLTQYLWSQDLSHDTREVP